VTSPTDAAQTYYLVLADTFGLRIHDLEYRNPDPLPTPSGPTGFDYTVERKERMIYFSSLQNGDLENFFGQIVSGTAASSTLPVTNLDPAAVQAGTPAELEVALQGVTNETHQVKVKLNGTEVGTINFGNTGHPVESFDIAPGMLLNGNNTVELISQNGASDVSLVDTLRLTYTHTFKAENNLMSLNMTDESVKRVGGFTSNNIRVLDTTDPRRVEEITRTVEINPEAGGGTYSVDMRVLGASFRQAHTLLVFTADGEAPAAVAKNNASDLWNQNAGADYVMITTGALKDSIEPLAQFRRSQGLVVNVVDVEDLYDEYSFGLHTPQAIRDYLEGAMTNWTRKPRYVLFAGDASYDPKNYFNLGMNDMVPTKLIDTSLSETASDDWLVDFDNDGLADISIGRLPVRTATSANLIVDKIINYENSAPDPARGVMLVSDTSFTTASGTIQSLLPNGLPVENINRGTADDATIHNQIVASLNQGPRVANYFGHGSHGVWTGASLLSSNDAPSLTNTNHLTVFTMMTCLNGIFQDAVNESLSEALLKSQGGAVAVWASSGFTEPAGQVTIDQEFYRLIFAAQPATLGDASRAAKATTSDADVRRTWTLFGDPAMRIK
jgi:FlaG/FlaF family flagellin (archaellin)